MNPQHVIEKVLDDAIRFGCAIGSWHTSNTRWHQTAGSDCVRAVKEAAAREIQSKIAEIEHNLCHNCGQARREEPNP